MRRKGDMMAQSAPESLKREHAELQAWLVAASRSGGKTAAAAQAVARALQPHFAREEQYALPPLGALLRLVTGDIPPDSDRIIEMAESLKRDLNYMLHEHRGIVIELHKLMDAATVEKRSEYVDLAERLILHAKTEEDVLYPAAVLVGEYLKLRSRGKDG